MSKYCLFLIVIYYLTGGNNSMSRFFKFGKLHVTKGNGDKLLDILLTASKKLKRSLAPTGNLGKSKEKFSQELEMSRSNYSRIESGKSDPTIKTLEQIAKLTNSTLVVDLIPNEPTEPEPETESEQVTLDLEMEEEKSNDFV